LGGRNFCPPSLSAAAEFRASETGAPPFDLFSKMIYYDYSMNPNQPQKNNSTTSPSSKEDFDGFKNETREIKIVQEMIKKEQVVKVSNSNPATEINYYKI